jgi:hypothetical protein
MEKGSVMRTTDQTGIKVPLWTEEEFVTELAGLSAEYAPRRFSLCLVHGEREDGEILGWGLAFEDRAIAYLPGDDETGGTFMRSGSAEGARRLLSRRADVRLVWLD